jgi:hypothetical protein
MPERRLSFLLVSTLLTIALGGWVLTSALSRTVGTAAQTQELLNKSGVYQAVIPSQVASVQESNPSLANIPLDNPEIQKLLGQSIDTKNLQAQGNDAVDAIYAWLEGKTDKPKIDISVMANQQSLAQAAGDYAAKKAAALPACAPGEADYAAFASDPLSASCLPAGMDVNMVRSSVIQSVSTNPALGSATKVTADDVKLSNGTPVMDSFNSAPKWYQRAQLLPLILSASAAVCILLLLLILRPLGGLKSTGKHLLSVGITLALLAIALAWAMEKLFTGLIPKSDNPNIADAIMKLSNLFNQSYRDNIVRLSIYLAIAGAGALIVAFALKRLPHRKPAAAPVRSTGKTVNKATDLEDTPSASSFTPLTTKSAPKLPARTHKPAAARTAAKKKTTSHGKKKA